MNKIKLSFSFIIYFVFITLSYNQNLKQILFVSTCLKNCRSCSQVSPSTCANANATTVTKCVPFFVGDDCILSQGYQNLFLENGSANGTQKFQGWSDGTAALLPQKICRPGIKNATDFIPLSNQSPRSTLGSFNLTNGKVLKKTFTLPNRQIQMLNFKFTFIINDDRLQKAVAEQNSNQNTSEEVGADGTITTTTTVQTLSIQGIQVNYQPFFYIKFQNPNPSTNEDPVLSQSIFSYRIDHPSRMRTDCGFIYQFQVAVPLKTPNPQRVLTTLQLQTRQGVQITWNLVQSRVDFGCGGFLASSTCDFCLAGFYQNRQLLQNKLISCGICPPACKTCTSMNKCTTCQLFAQIDNKTGICSYPKQSFFTKSNNYTLNIGELKSSTSSFINNLIVSKAGKLSFDIKLPKIQAFAIKLYLLYTNAFITRTQNLVIQFILYSNKQRNNVLTSTTFNNTNLQRYTGIYDQIISKNNKLFIKQVTLNNQFSDSKIVNDQLYLDVIATSTLTDPAIQQSLKQFYLYNINVIQLSCRNQCFNCSYDVNTVKDGKCIQCQSFFVTGNCQTCAQGFYNNQPTVNKPFANNFCVKCYSNCKQCKGQSKQECVQCYNDFALGTLLFDFQCIKCLYDQNNQIINSQSCTPECKRDYPLTTIKNNQNCSFCLDGVSFDQIRNNQNCRDCWIRMKLAYSSCQPVPSKGYQFLGTDVINGVVEKSVWSTNKSELIQINCTQFYSGIYGVKKNPTETAQTISIKRTQPSLPKHYGLTTFLTIMKLDSWPTNEASILIKTSTSSYKFVSKEVKFSNTAGSNICEGPGKQMLFAFTQTIQNHQSQGQFSIQIVGNSVGLFVWDYQVYLGNCNQCSRNRLIYNIEFIPRYLRDNSQAGLNIWLRFNQPTKFINNQNMVVQKSFQFTIDKLSLNKYLTKSEIQNLLKQSQQLRYFLPINTSFNNGTLNANTTYGNNIIAINQQQIQGRLLFIQKLSNYQVSDLIQRFDNVNLDDRLAISQIWQFFNFFNWFTLITMIVCAFFGVGIIFQQFSILLQLQFWHIYITSQLLPATFKVPLQAMQKMENLNFFAYDSEQNIQNSWVNQPLDYTPIVSPHIFEQYNVDIFFLRSFYPLIIVNLIYLGWFIILVLVYKFVRQFRKSQNRIIKFLRNIPRRPTNYVDQIWRYQFLTTVWAAFLQFLNFDNTSSFKRFILALCIISLIVTFAWPIFVTLYTYRRNKQLNVQHFLYSYEDIFYRKITSISDKQFKYYFYIIIRYLRYLFYAIFIVFFAYQPVIGPAILIFANIAELGYLFKFKVFQDQLYLTFKVFQNLLFIVVQILLLIVYGGANTMQTEGFLSLGYAIIAIFVIMVVNGIIRFLYLLWKKTSDFLTNKFDYGQHGEVSDYANRNPVSQVQKFDE